MRWTASHRPTRVDSSWSATLSDGQHGLEPQAINRHFPFTEPDVVILPLHSRSIQAQRAKFTERAQPQDEKSPQAQEAAEETTAAVTCFRAGRLGNSPAVARMLGPPKTTGPQRMAAGHHLRATDRPLMAADHPLRAAAHPLMAADHPLMAADHPLRAADHPLRAADRPLRAADHPLRAADHPLMAADHPLPAAFRPLRAGSAPKRAASGPITGRSRLALA